MERLHRSRKNKVILGVCGGLAEYFRIDATLIRIVCILVTMSGVGFFIYVIAALIMPEDRGYSVEDDQWKCRYGAGSGSYSNTGSKEENGTGADTENDTGSSYESGFNKDNEWDRPPKYNSEKNKLLLGGILVGLGILILGKQFIPALFNLKYLIPILLIGIGGIIVYRGRR